MASSTYKDIIDDKVAAWRKDLQKLEEQAAKAPELERLKSQIESAIVQLHLLDEQENVKNTMATKDEILRIFNAIDKDFRQHQEQTPYML